VGIVADEWVNSTADVEKFLVNKAVDWVHIKMPNLGGLQHSVDAVLACHAAGVGSLLGGSCIETDLSTKSSVHVGLATQARCFLVKPGMGINEGISLVRNEIARTLGILAGRKK
jgi:methylaspartate ammonia-lyase